MENKYYTPTISEFYVGFEYEEFVEKYSEYGAVQLEGLVEDLTNMITGHYDVLFKSATGENSEIKWMFI